MLIGAVLTMMVGGVLAACSAPEQASEATDNKPGFEVVTINLPDGGSVQCVFYNRHKEAGLSCDWANAKRPGGKS